MLEPTGFLVFTIDTYLGDGAIRCQWLESEAKRLEDQLPDILRSLALAGPALVKQREEREVAERKRQEAERLRQIENERRQKERNQWRRFGDAARQWEDAQRTRQFLAALERQEFDPEQLIGGRSLGEWLTWARNQVDKNDPANAGSPSVFENIASVAAWTYRD